MSCVEGVVGGLRESSEGLVDSVSTALGREPASLLLRNCRLVNVYSEEIYSTDIAIRGNRIAAISPGSVSRAETIMDCDGLYAVPGFVEPHMHMEGSYVAPAELARLLVPNGTTSLVADLTGCAYVSGVRSARLMIDEAKRLPWRVFAESPSYGPYVPCMTTGGAIGLEEVKEILEWPETVSVGQVPHQDILALNEGFTEKIAAYRSAGRRVCGQSFTGLPREDIDAYVAGGVTGDLGCKTYDDILTRLRAGLYLQLVEAPAGARRNLGRMLEGVVRQGLSTRNCGFCVDDANVHDIVSEGFGWLAAHVKIALEAGVSPVEVFQMASFNTASHYGKDHLVGSITPGRLADILLLRDLDQFPPAVVIVDGQVVARDGIPLWDRELRSYPKWALETVDFHSSISAERFSIPAPDGASGARVRGIDLPSPDATGYNRNLVTELPVRDGIVQADLEHDIVPLYVVERYGKNGNVGCAFVQGSGLKKGAIGTSLAAGDGNVVVLGCDALSVMTCLKTIEDLNGGFVVAQDDNVLASVPLPLLGQMSIEPYEEMLEQFEEALNAARSLGCTLTNPFSTIGLTVLPTVAEVGMSDYGLIDAVTGEVVETVVAWL